LEGTFFSGENFISALEEPQYFLGPFVRPIGKYDDVIAVRFVGGVFFLDDDGAVESALFLKSRVRVIPIGAGLMQGKFEDVGRVRLDGRVRDSRHAVLTIGQQKTVPVDRGAGFQPVMDANSDSIPFAPAQGGSRNLAVYRQGLSRATCNFNDPFLDEKIGFDDSCFRGSDEKAKDEKNARQDATGAVSFLLGC